MSADLHAVVLRERASWLDDFGRKWKQWMPLRRDDLWERRWAFAFPTRRFSGDSAPPIMCDTAHVSCSVGATSAPAWALCCDSLRF